MVLLRVLWRPWPLRGFQRRQARKSNRNSGSLVLRGSSPETPLEPKSAKDNEKVVPRSTLKNTGRRVLHKRSLGIPPNPQNDSSAQMQPSSSHFHLYFQNDRLCVQWAPLWHPFGWFWVLLGTTLADKNRIICVKSASEQIRQLQKFGCKSFKN